MFGQVMNQKPESPPVFLVARLNDRAQPMHRGALYEDPLHEVLTTQEIGEVTGGGTQLGKDNEIEFCDIEICLHDAAAEHIDLVKNFLEECGAPKGSKLLWGEPALEVEFGVTEGLAVYLNGTDLPAEVYQECDVNFICKEFTRLLDTEGRIHSYWQGPTETALYMYGRSFETMKARLADFLNTYPLCQRARIVQIA